MNAQASGPSCAAFIEKAAITSLSHKQSLVTELEGLLRDCRSKYLEDLEKLSGSLKARLDLAVLADLIIRCLLAKPWPRPKDPQGIVIQLGTGKYSKEKVHELCCKWASWIDVKYGSTFAQAHELLEVQEENGNDEPAETVDLKALTLLKRCDSDAVPDLGTQLKRGDAVKVARRMNCSLPVSAKREDIPVSTPATVVGLPDADSDKVIINALVSM